MHKNTTDKLGKLSTVLSVISIGIDGYQFINDPKFGNIYDVK